jgi:methylated-DNA-protein-cysteine methyltransferase related protein
MKENPGEEFFSTRIKNAVKRIPYGKVATYGQIAALTGNRNYSKQVAGVLHVLSGRSKLPWYRVVNRVGEISLEPGDGFEEQKHLLEKEGIVFNRLDRIDLGRFLWNPFVVD